MKLVGFLNAAADPDAPALVAPTGIWSHAELAATIADRVHALAERGVARGQRLLVLHDHDEEAIFALAAASALGLQLIMPYSLHAAAPGEWTAMLRAARPDHVLDLRAAAAGIALPSVIRRADLLAQGRAPHREALVIEAPDPIEDFLVLFSSGTTGAPKAICISEALVCRRVASVSARLGFDAAARIFMTGLLNNTTGVIFAFGAFAHGATLFLPQTRDVARWPEQVAAQRLTHMMLRPAALRRFLSGADSHDLTSLRTMAYGAAAMPRPLLEAARRRMPCDWVQGYGLSETFGPFCWLDEADHRAGRHLGEAHVVGRPDDTLEVRIDAPPGEAGEVLVRGPALMRGYLDAAAGRPVAPAPWFRTGDHGLFDSDGLLVLKGRASGTLLTGDGHRIYPEEVEGALVEVAGVTESLLLALPDRDDPADVPVGCIHGPIAGEDAGTIGVRVADALAGTLAREKWPAFLFASHAPFPRNANDKIDRGAVAHALRAAPLIALVGEG